jgi:hypothetical protein
MTERHLSQEKRRRALAVILLAILFCISGPLLALDWSVPSGTLDHQMVTLSHARAGQGVADQAQMGTASRMRTRLLLITGEAATLRKARGSGLWMRWQYDVRGGGGARQALPARTGSPTRWSVTIGRSRPLSA